MISRFGSSISGGEAVILSGAIVTSFANSASCHCCIQCYVTGGVIASSNYGLPLPMFY